ncbi:hypothetical protein [Brevundimonas sp.]|uniref:hypothetical protein n=1 Tax=Brevundimonas sp. TaxID=1871086 RepID=UPI0025C5D2EE|nr:hypothetical protein [Brevundimonas sp.]
MRRADYFAGLGEFIHVFSQVEAQLQYALWSEAGVSPEVAKAVFSGVRLDQGKSLIIRLQDATRKARNPVLERAFSQLTVLTNARNDIVHYGARFRGGGIEVSTAMAAHIPDRLRIIPIDEGTFRAMIADLYQIKWVIDLHIIGKGRTPPDYGKWVRQAAELPWQYTPPQQSPPQKPRQTPHPMRSRQRGASQE